jgi:hypothetical protein
MDEKLIMKFKNIVTNEFPAFAQMLGRCLNFDRWGFGQTFCGITPEFAPSLIYDSKYCRVRFLWYVPDRYELHETISILYGRQHASNDHWIITYNDEKCYCWHDLKNILNFLDGLSPQEASERAFKRSIFMEEFESLNLGNDWSQSEWLVRMHAAIWEHYGQHLFDLLDLSHPALWEQYVYFIKEYYKLNLDPIVPGRPCSGCVC